MTVAETILRQLGPATLALLGAKQLIDLGDGLKFKIGRNSKGCTHVQIDLDRTTDTYRVTTYKVRGVRVTLLHEDHLVYADTLHNLLETRTGLYTRL